MSKPQTLTQALYLARTGKSRELSRAIQYLNGCPVGGWGETQQARSRVVQELPIREMREYTLGDFIEAAYDVDHANRYQTRTTEAKVG